MRKRPRFDNTAYEMLFELLLFPFVGGRELQYSGGK